MRRFHFTLAIHAALFAIVASFALDAAVAFAESEAVESLVTLSWTAPGDDGTVGRATRYEVRYSQLPITAANYALATIAPGPPAPANAGTSQTFTIGGLKSGTTYYFAMKTVDEAGNWSVVSNVAVRQAPVTGVGDGTLQVSLSNPWPSPARELVRCAFVLPQAGPVDVQLFDVTGRHVRTLADGWREAGRGELTWDLRDRSGSVVPTGMYLMRARLGGRDWSRQVLVVR